MAKGLLFYYFPRKIDLLRTLFAERLPTHCVSSLAGVAVQGDVAGSLLRLADRIGLTGQHWQVLNTIPDRHREDLFLASASKGLIVSQRSAGDTRRPRLRWALVVSDGMLDR